MSNMKKQRNGANTGNDKSSNNRARAKYGKKGPKGPTSKYQKGTCPADQSAEVASSRPNDWRWYAQNEQLVRDYASLPFGNALGSRVDFGLASLNSTAVPGVLAIDFIPTVGVADNEVSPINVAMRRLYSFVRHANSGSANYDAPDLMLYMICVDSAIMYHSYLKRLYGIMRDYSALNRYYPKALIEANHVNFDSIQVNLNNLRGYINQYALKLSQLWIPNSMSYMARHSWMCEGIYMDSNSAKAQTYLYVPVGFYKFGFTSEGVGKADTASLPYINTRLAEYEDLVKFGDSLLNPMISNEDFGIMSGDILKAFGTSGIIQISGITEDYQVLPTYDPEVLSQIENCTLVDNQLDTNIANWYAGITQETAVGTGYLISHPWGNRYITGSHFTIQADANRVMDDSYEAIRTNKLLNFHHQDVQPSEIMVATRGTALIERTAEAHMDSYYVYAPFSATSCGSEIYLRGTIYYYTHGGDDATLSKFHFNTCTGIGIPYSANNVSENIKNVTFFNFLLGCFDWHPAVAPFIYFYKEGEADTTVWSDIGGFIQDVDNYTLVDETNLRNLHNTALLSEFTTPMLG